MAVGRQEGQQECASRLRTIEGYVQILASFFHMKAKLKSALFWPTLYCARGTRSAAACLGIDHLRLLVPYVSCRITMSPCRHYQRWHHESLKMERDGDKN